MKSNHTEALK